MSGVIHRTARKHIHTHTHTHRVSAAVEGGKQGRHACPGSYGDGVLRSRTASSLSCWSSLAPFTFAVSVHLLLSLYQETISLLLLQFSK